MNPRSLADELAVQLEQANELMTGERPKIQAEPLTGAPLDADFVVWKQDFNIPGAAVYIAAPAAVWKGAGMRLLRAAGIEDGDEGIARSTFSEVLSMGLSSLSRTISAEVRKEVTTTAAHDVMGLPQDCRWFAFQASYGNGETDQFFAGLNPEITNLLVAQAPQPDAVKRVTNEIASPRLPPSMEKSKTLDLLLDVELPVSVSFGRAQLPLKDVIKLNTGSIIELNRTIAEPVEIIVNNCVIARGEVVVVEGNFGVRIHQVISRQDRLRTLY